MTQYVKWQYEYQVEYDKWRMSHYAFDTAEAARRDAHERLLPGVRWRLVEIIFHETQIIGD